MNWRFLEKNMLRSLPWALLLLWIELDRNSVRTWKNMARAHTWNWEGHIKRPNNGYPHHLLAKISMNFAFSPWSIRKTRPHNLYMDTDRYVLTYEQSIRIQCTSEIYFKIPKEHWNFPNYHFCILNYDGGKDRRRVRCMHIFVLYTYIHVGKQKKMERKK